MILNVKTGKILEIPDNFIIDARRIFESLRSTSLNSTQVFENIQIYDISPGKQ